MLTSMSAETVAISAAGYFKIKRSIVFSVSTSQANVMWYVFPTLQLGKYDHQSEGGTRLCDLCTWVVLFLEREAR
jgi:hypothetical protein